ncbi:MAG: fibronectin type III domain-containing protein [Bacteroidales bacterium]|nr:fibronectin type III domain-containing protein [Bacteroidales bacterium]
MKPNRKKHCLSLLLLVWMAWLLPCARAQNVWNGTSDISWYNSSQTTFDIFTPEQLAGVAQLMTNQVTNFNGVTLNLRANIWLNHTGDSTRNWIPIGGDATASSEDQHSSSAYAFAGHFKGHGHVIYNMYCEKANYYQAGLFGCVQYPCTIDSLVMINPVVKARGMSGSLIGYTLNSGNVYVSSCQIINCRVAATGNNNNGGILGANYKMQYGSYWTYIQDCAVTGTLSGKYIGGIVGNGQRVQASNTYFAGALNPVIDGNSYKYGAILGHCSSGNYQFSHVYSNASSSTTYGSGRDGVRLSDAMMRSSNFLDSVGSAFVMDAGINNGYPIMGYIYSLNPSVLPSCSPVQNLTINSISGGDVTLTWDSNLVGGLTQYHVCVYNEVTHGAQEYTTTSDNYTVTGLSELTPYRFGIYVVCADNTASDTAFVYATMPCHAPGTLTIGHGDNFHSCLPTYPYYDYSLTQQVIPASAFVHDAQTYSAIAFQYVYNGTRTRNLTIYLSHVPNGQTLSNGWITPSSSVTFQQVFTGNVTFSPNEVDADSWFQIELDNAFNYEGGRDVLLTVVDRTGSWENFSSGFKVHNDNTTVNRTRYHYRDNYPYNYANPGVSGNLSSNANNVRFVFCDQNACAHPQGVTISAVNHHSALVSWAAGSASSWLIEYKTADASSWTSLGTINTNSYTFSGLSPHTTYAVRVRALCSTVEMSLWSDELYFQTDCEPMANLPFTEDFEDASSLYNSGSQENYIYCWSRYASDPDHYVYIPSNSYAHSGSHFLDFHHTTNCFNIAVMPTIDAAIDIHTVQVRFQACRSGSSGTLEVGVMTNRADPSTFVPVDTIDLTDYNTYQYGEFTVPFFNYMGPGRYVAFRVSYAASCGFYVDDVTLEAVPACASPVVNSVTVSNITDHDASVSFVDMNPDHHTWVIHYRAVGPSAPWSAVTVTTTTGNVISGLAMATNYQLYVKTLCDGVEGDLQTNTVTFNTTMPTVALPYVTDFSIDQGWLLNNGTCANYWTMGVTSTSQSALFVTHDGISEGYSTVNSATVMAEKLFTLPATDSVHVEFDLRVGGESTWDYLKAFLAPADEQYVPGTAHNAQSDYSYAVHAIDFSAFKAQTNSSPTYPYMLNLSDGNTVHVSVNIPNLAINGQGKFVFLWRNDGVTGKQPGAVVTNFFMSGVASCPVPTNLQQEIALKDAGGIRLSWSDNAGASQWVVRYRPLGGEWTIVLVEGVPSYEILGLENGVEYEVQVRAVCDDAFSEWSEMMMATATNSCIEDHLSKSITLYPNPATEMVNVEVSDANILITGVEVYNLYGQMVETFHGTSLQNRATINISSLADGMYFVRVATEEGVVTKGFVKR